MLARLKSRLYLLKSRTVRWMGGYLPGLGVGLELLRSELPVLQDYIPAGLYRGLLLACVVALVLRVITRGPLSDYRPSESEGK